MDAGSSHTDSMRRRLLCHEWLLIAGFVLFIGITLHAHKDDSAPRSFEDACEDRASEVADILIHAVPAYDKAIKDASTKYALDPRLIAAIIYIESGGNVRAISPRGARGLMQLTPAVYKQYDVHDPFDIEQNIFGGTAYLAHLLRTFDGNLEHALAAYNCGPTRVIEYKGLPPFKETQDYVERIMEHYLKKEIPAGSMNRES